MTYSFDTAIKKIAPLWLKMVKEIAPESTPNVEWWIDFMEKLKKSDKYVMVTAENEDGLVGFCDVIAFDDPDSGKKVATGQYLYVVPKFRNNIVADKIYKLCDLRLVERGHVVEMATIHCFKERKRFWERAGFSQYKTVMKKPIIRRTV